ncbi:MAG: thiamine-binding protein [Acidimicrobiia bacterium]|nr:thiamine-binding protein [Acidimicrobiia bacterium]
MSRICSAEFLVEPFEEGNPGPHVIAAVAAVEALGFEPVVGPFGTTIEGDPHLVMEAVRQLLDAATDAGASRVSIQVNTCDG